MLMHKRYSGRVFAALAAVLCMLLVGCDADQAASDPGGADASDDTVELERYTSHIDEHVEGFEMVKVPAGTVQMPDPDDPEQMIEQEVGPFWIAVTPVTWDEFNVWAMKEDEDYDEIADALTRPTVATEDFPMDRGWGWEDRPAVGMTEKSARYYVQWYAEQADGQYRLPTESEWIYAALAGTESFDMDEDELAEHAWHAENAEGMTHPVGQLKPNAWGLYDMLGNVAEWVQGVDDQYVVMGGSHRDSADDISPYYRQAEDPTWQGMVVPESPWWLARGGFTGLRLVRDVDDAERD